MAAWTRFRARFFFSNSSDLRAVRCGRLAGFARRQHRGIGLEFPLHFAGERPVLRIVGDAPVLPAMVNEVRFGYVRINNSAINNAACHRRRTSGINRPMSNITDSIYKFTFGSSGFQIGPTPQANTSNLQNNFNCSGHGFLGARRARLPVRRRNRLSSIWTSSSRKPSTASFSSPIRRRRRLRRFPLTLPTSRISWSARRNSALAAAAFTTTNTSRTTLRCSSRTTGRRPRT